MVDVIRAISPTTPNRQIRVLAYFLKYVDAASANKRIVKIQSDELLNPVFLAIDRILILIALLCEAVE